MRHIIGTLCIACAGPAWADLRPDGTTGALGLAVEQGGVMLPLTEADGAYIATLSAAPFAFVLPVPLPDVLGVTFGAEGLFDLIDLPPEQVLFGPGSGYAREEGADAPHFMADPLCADDLPGPGFNYLDFSRQIDGAYPVSEIHADAASRDCVAAGRWPLDTDILGRVDPLYVVLRAGDRTERLILRFVGS